jgi:DNA replication protein DnaC
VARNGGEPSSSLPIILPRKDWGKVLGDNAAAGAILDRFLHHAEIIRLEGRSYRMHDRRELRKGNAENLTLTQETK